MTTQEETEALGPAESVDCTRRDATNDYKLVAVYKDPQDADMAMRVLKLLVPLSSSAAARIAGLDEADDIVREEAERLSDCGVKYAADAIVERIQARIAALSPNRPLAGEEK